ncbi:sodium:solute symporter family protein [Aeromicrobium sp. CF3.5]|uniref:sodium:solute symporter family protein n=1 Tax=Aeromicrobium sp. CF3.5 TaxID=3373078 RepID=UPI003EE42C46
MNFGYLTVIVVYFIIVLLIGVWGAKKGSYDSYTVADRDVSLPLSVGTFFATYISSATVIGFVGYTSLSGASIFPTYFWGFALGWLALSMIAGRMRRLGLRSVPSYFEARFGGTSLRVFSALVTVVAFSFSVMTQLVAGSLVLSVVIGIDQIVGVILLATVLIIYTVLGGLVSVVRTDLIQGCLIVLAVVTAFVVALAQNGTAAFDVPENLQSMLQGSTPTTADMIALVLVAFGGVAAQPYYLHRFFSARNEATARQMVGIGALLAGIVYFMIAVLGIVMPRYVGTENLGDSAIIQFGLQNGGFLGALILIGIICAVQSTVDSALHLVGVNFTNDVVGVAKPAMTDEAKHTLARATTAVVGVLCTTGAVVFIVADAGFITILLNIWLGTLSSALLVPLYSSIFLRWVSRLGALLSSVGGFIGFFVALSAIEIGNATLPFHQIYFGLGLSVLGLIVGSLVQRADPDDEVVARFFTKPKVTSGA